MEFANVNKKLHQKQLCVKQEHEALEKLFFAEKASNIYEIYENSTTLSAPHDSVDDEFYEEVSIAPIVKKEIEIDHENNFDLLESDIKKEFESLNNNQGEIIDNCTSSGKTTCEINYSAYSCQICKTVVRTFYDFEAHRKQHLEMVRKEAKCQDTKTRVRCGFCNKTFKSDEGLAAHHRNNHKELKFSCKYCGKIYLSMYGLAKHIKTVHFQFECEKCKYIFYDRALFKSHQRQHKEGKIECQYCQKEFDDNRGLHIHVNMQHKKDGAMHTCDICHKEFINIQLLKRHYGRAHDKCFKCPHCDKAFALRCSFERHFLTHTGAKDYKCDVCGREFSRQRSLKNHVALHSDVRSYKCDQCPRTFKTQPNLHNHKFSHSKVEHFQCAMCLKKFTIKWHLIKHIKNHATLERHKCQYCAKQFKSTMWYKKHTNRCVYNVSKQEYSCNFCGNWFPSQVLLDDHLAKGNDKNANLLNNNNNIKE